MNACRAMRLSLTTVLTGLQEKEAAEVSALADEADVPLDQLLAQYGFRIGLDGTKQRILDGDAANAETGRPPPGAKPCAHADWCR